MGICGGSGSGKSYVLDQISDRLSSDTITFIAMDNYYVPMAELPLEEEDLVNFDHPDAFQWGELLKDMKTLMRGDAIQLKEYTFNNPKAKPKTIEYHPNPIVIIEGIHVFYHQDLRSLMDLKIFIDAEEHLKLSRRLIRDDAERGYSQKEVLRDYERFVMPMYKQYVEPLKSQCDLIIPNNQTVEIAVDVLKNHLQTILMQTKSDNF